MRAALWRAREGWRRWGGAAWPWLLLLLLTAALCFGSYYRSGINFKDEGGTEVLVAQRLLAGQRPFLDVVLGYNVMWFYPIVELFKLGGVSFVHLRAYCFCLSTITAAIGFLALTRVGARPWLAYLAGLLLILVPGMTFKNYMPLLAVTNSFCLLQFVLAGRRGAWLWLTVGGLWLGISFLIRIDVAIFVTCLWLGGLGLRALTPQRPRGEALPLVLGGPALLLVLVLAVHFPVWLDARHRGFDGPFVQQYSSWPLMFADRLQHRFGHPAPLPLPAPSRPKAPAEPRATPAPGAQAEAPQVSHETLRRKGLADLGTAKNAEERALIILLYVPLLTLGALIVWSLLRLWQGWRRNEPETYTGGLGALLLVGGAFTAFPQYFFFRPDGPHLSEFSPGYWTAAIGALILLAGTGVVRSRSRQIAAAVLSAVLVLHSGLFLWRLLPDRWTGTMAARKNRTQLFHGENGVDVYVTRRELEGLQALLKVIREHSQPGQPVIAWPYDPSINVLANRPTYEKNVYVDNETAPPTWNQETIARLARKKPPVVVISDWAINGSEDSRFSVWARPVKEWVQAHYTLQGTYLDIFEVYTLDPPAEAKPQP